MISCLLGFQTLSNNTYNNMHYPSKNFTQLFEETKCYQHKIDYYHMYEVVLPILKFFARKALLF